jgi:Rps23 Pro-64 3,4-dihydroxylase Tpa1-like proline 4-hydroxylase
MQIKRDFLSNSELQKVFDGLQYMYAQNYWAINHNVWTEKLLDKVHGTVATAGIEGEHSDKLTKILKPHLPECREIKLVYNLWYPYSGIAWHNDEAHKFGATLYLNEVWDPNSGGIFLYEDKESGEIKGHIPEQNTMVISDDEEMHCVTTVNPAVPEPRMTMQIWGED